MASVRDTLKRAGAGRILYQMVHRPLALAAQSLREGGPLEQWHTARGRALMEKAAAKLPPVAIPTSGTALELHLLTGRQFWFQTAFCLWTFAHHARRAIVPVLYDDGSLTPDQGATLHHLFPAGRIVSRTDSLGRLDEVLPTIRFPFLRERWLYYPNIRKLTDPHLASCGWKLVVDSDLLFFRLPSLLVDWLDRPQSPLHAVDIATSYGYSSALLETLAKTRLAERLNVGLCGLASEEIDWEQMEFWCRTLIETAGTHYYLEQALVALLLAGRACTIAPSEDYVTLPLPPEAVECHAVMHHYVAGSKAVYFRRNWRHALATAESSVS